MIGRTVTSWLRKAGGMLAISCILLVSCSNESGSEAASGRKLAQLPAGIADAAKLTGNDSRAWLSAFGGPGDSNYCDANLRLPLSPEPAWEWDYSAGSFTQFFIADITHFDGQLYVTGYSQQLASLSVDNGTELFNRYLDVAIPQKPDRSLQALRNAGNNTVMFSRQSIHPSGKLLMLTGFRGERMLFDISSDSATHCVWQGEQHQPPYGFLLTGDSIVHGLDEELSVEHLDGSEHWEARLNSTPIDIVTAGDGLLLLRNSARNMWAYELESGRLRWSLTDASDYTTMAVDPVNQLLYMCYFDERLDAINIEDGSLAWSYDFSYLLPREQRQPMVDQANELVGLDPGKNGYNQASLDNVSTVVRPDGIVLAIDFGFMLFLDQYGNLKWLRDDMAPISSIRGFRNGVLVQHFWFQPELATQDLILRASALPMTADRPDWEEIAANAGRLDDKVAEQLELREMDPDGQRQFALQQRSSQQNEEPLKILYTQLAACSMEDGSEMDAVPLEGWVRSGFTPAQDKIVFENVSISFCWYMNYWNPGDRKISAYNWLEPGGES